MTDYMKEAERLLDEHDCATMALAVGSEYAEVPMATRAALLAHIQRAAVPEPEQIAKWAAPAPDHFRDAAGVVAEPTEVPMRDVVGYVERWGGACRDCADESGVCPSTGLPCGGQRKAIEYVIRALQYGVKHGYIADLFGDAAKMTPAPAEVLMPKPVAYGFGNTAITGHTNRLMMVRIDIPGGDQYAGAFWLPLVLADEAHTYGIACRAAGEAAGYARGLAEAGRDAEIEALRLYVRALCKAVDAATDFAGTVAGGASWWDDVWADHAAALDRARERISQAALRGEVKT